MSGKQLTPRVYNQNDWKNATRMDRLLIHVVEPELFPLNNQDSIYLERIRKCFIVVTSTFSDITMRAILSREFPTLNSNQLSKLKQDCNLFYDHFSTETKKFNWIRQHERIMRHLELAQKEKDLSAIAKFEKILQAMRLEIEDQGEETDDFIPEFTFTNDPKFLNIQDIEYTEEE